MNGDIEVRMRARTVALVLALALMPWCGEVWAAGKIEWHPYEAGMARSRFEKKKALVYFYTDSCPYCTQMEKMTFSNPEVASLLNRNFIPIRVNAEREPAVANLFRVKGFPDIWFMTEAGDVIGHRPGYMPSDEMLKVLNVVLTGQAAK
jgi:thioredoxin-related protein